MPLGRTATRVPGPTVIPPPSAPRSAPRRRSATSAADRTSRGWVVAVSVAMVIATGYFLVPVFWLVVASTKSSGDLFSTPGFVFSRFHLFQNLADLSRYDGGIFWRWTLNSILYSVVGSAVTTMVCAFTGYALAIYHFRGRKTILGAVLASLLVPGTILAQPTYLLLVGLGLNNTYAGLLLPALVYPFGVLLAYIYCQSSVPIELIEAARLDGANELRIFISIGLRLMMTGLVTILLFAFLGSWNSYMLPLLVLTDQRLMPLTVGLTGWNQSSITIPGLQILTVVGSLVSVVPIMVVFVALQRFWKAGISAGGVRF